MLIDSNVHQNKASKYCLFFNWFHVILYAGGILHQKLVTSKVGNSDISSSWKFLIYKTCELSKNCTMFSLAFTLSNVLLKQTEIPFAHNLYFDHKNNNLFITSLVILCIFYHFGSTILRVLLIRFGYRGLYVDKGQPATSFSDLLKSILMVPLFC